MRAHLAGLTAAGLTPTLPRVRFIKPLSPLVALFCASMLILSLAPAIARAAEDVMVFVALVKERGPFMGSFLHFERTFEQNYIGDMDVILMIDGQVGTEETMMLTLRRGRVQGAMLTVPGTATAVPEIALLMAPYLFDSFAEADFVLDNFVTESVRALFAARGVHFIKWIDSGWHIVFARTPVKRPEDLTNIRMRAAGGEAARFFLEATQADVVPLPFNDLIPGLETGLVDGGSTNIAMYRSVGLYELAPHLTLTYHSVNPGVIMVNKEWFEGLPENNQRVFEESFLPSQELRDIVRDGDAEHLAFVKSEGIVPYTPSLSDHAQWRRAAASTHTRLIDSLGGESQSLYDQILAGKAAFKRQTVIAR